MPIVDSFIAELDREAGITRRVLERVPEDKLKWQPHPKSMSLGQLALHIAALPGHLAEVFSLESWERPDMGERAEPASKDEILSSFETALEKARKNLGSWDDATAQASWSLTKNGEALLSAPRIGMVRSIMMNHAYHHRGQLAVYLRMLNVPVPSIYGPSADENPFA
jgi:uncharacterized damage-inducible protein DinB